jgi:hypothetical protein
VLTVAALLIVALGLAVVAVVTVRWWTWRPVITHRVLVQTDSEVSFQGVVVSRRGTLLVLDDVTVHSGSSTSRVDGSVIVERTRVLYMQRVS